MFTIANKFDGIIERYAKQLEDLKLTDSDYDLFTHTYQSPIESEKRLRMFTTKYLNDVVRRQVAKGVYAFTWAEQYTIPLTEPKVQPLLYSLIEYHFKGYGIDCLKEPEMAGGKVDFYVTKTSSKNKIMKVCIELKNAHHNDLESSLKYQLPAYMDSCGAKNGIFIILWYKNPEQPKPTKYDTESDLLKHLDSIKSKNIDVVIINCCKPIVPSELKSDKKYK